MSRSSRRMRREADGGESTLNWGGWEEMVGFRGRSLMPAVIMQRYCHFDLHRSVDIRTAAIEETPNGRSRSCIVVVEEAAVEEVEKRVESKTGEQ